MVKHAIRFYQKWVAQTGILWASFDEYLQPKSSCNEIRQILEDTDQYLSASLFIEFLSCNNEVLTLMHLYNLYS